MPVYEFRCPCGKTIERLEPMGTEAIPCSCGELAVKFSVYRIFSKPFVWLGNIGAPAAAAYLERAVELDTMCADRETATGTEIKSRDFAYSPGTKEKFWDNKSGKPIKALDPGD